MSNTKTPICVICHKEATDIYENIFDEDEIIYWCGDFICGYKIQLGIDYAEEHRYGS
jgi:hypothetical protein